MMIFADKMSYVIDYIGKRFAQGACWVDWAAGIICFRTFCIKIHRVIDFFCG